MIFRKALQALKDGNSIKRKDWLGYWRLEEGRVMMYCKHGEVIDLLDSKDVLYTLTNIAEDDWCVILEEIC